MKTQLTCWLAALLTLAATRTVHAQGRLTPPGAPAPAMKSLDQIEPRTPVDAAHTGGGGSAEFLITQPGSYYLTTNIVGVTGLHGINISASGVTLDLNGFSLQGSSLAFDAIYIHAGCTNITIRNGTISGWNNPSPAYGHGVACHANNVALERLLITGCASAGITADNAVQLSRVQVLNSAGAGFTVGPGSTLEGCSAQGNGSYGFVANNNCIFKECSATGNTNTGIYGINDNNCVIQDCTAVGNGRAYFGVDVGDGISVGNGGLVRGCSTANNSSNGFTAGNGCSIEHCTASSNIYAGFYLNSGTVSGCAANNNRTDGIDVETSGIVSDCSAQNNDIGIFASGCVVHGCQVQANARFDIYLIGSASSVSGCVVDESANSFCNCILADTDGCQIIGNTCYGGNPGVQVFANNCRVDGNQVLNSYNGIIIDVGRTNNVIVRNSVSGGGGYSIPALNDVGPIGTAATATSPWANISH